MEKLEKKYTFIAKKLAKSMYKAVAKAIHDKEEAKEVVEDVLDPNYTAEVDPDKIPSKRKINIMNKSKIGKCLKSEEDVAKGVDKLRLFLDKKSRNNSNL